jgi:hypothetical protein
MGFWAAPCLGGDEVIVVVGGEGAFGSCDDEAASGLGLDGPGVGEGSPTGLEFGEAVGVSGDDDGVFIDFESVRLVDDGGDVDGALSVLEPGSEG